MSMRVPTARTKTLPKKVEQMGHPAVEARDPAQSTPPYHHPYHTPSPQYHHQITQFCYAVKTR